MKGKRILILLLVMTLCGGSMLFASSVSQKIRVIVNGSVTEDTGVMLDGRTYLPLRELSSALMAMVIWDNNNKQAYVYRPNVHMFLFQDTKTFGSVSKGSRLTFNVMAQVDNLRVDISAVRIVIADPAGREQLIQSLDVNEQKSSFWFNTRNISYSFDASGTYAVRFYMKPLNSEEWVLVSEKTIPLS